LRAVSFQAPSNLARQTGQPFDVLLTRFVHERLLYRLSRYADRFVLKGAMLLTTWLPEAARGTRDLDLLGFGCWNRRRLAPEPGAHCCDYGMQRSM
jgi:hypothetical protein